MTLSEAIEPYRNKDWPGAIGLRPGEMCDNFHLFTAHYHNLLWQLGQEESRTRYAEFLVACQIEVGKFSRFPGSKSQMSQDELYGIIYLTEASPRGALNYLRQYNGVYNTTDGPATPESYLWRFHDLVCMLYVASDTPLSLLDQAGWIIDAITSTLSPRENTSGKLIKYLQCACFKGRVSWMMDLCIVFWSWLMKRKYPGGARELFGIYFPGHPFAEYAPEDFEIRSITRGKET